MPQSTTQASNTFYFSVREREGGRGGKKRRICQITLQTIGLLLQSGGKLSFSSSSISGDAKEWSIKLLSSSALSSCCSSSLSPKFTFSENSVAILAAAAADSGSAAE